MTYSVRPLLTVNLEINETNISTKNNDVRIQNVACGVFTRVLEKALLWGLDVLNGIFYQNDFVHNISLVLKNIFVTFLANL